MTREKKILMTSTLDEAIELLSKRQLNRFAAVVIWHQLHNNLRFLLDETSTKHLLVDMFISKRIRTKSIEERRAMVLNYLKLHLIDNRAEMYLFQLAKGAAENKNVFELNAIAERAKKSYGLL